MLALKCYVLFASFVCCCEQVTVDDDDVSVVCVIKFEFEIVVLLHKIVYTESTVLNFSKSGIKSSSSESDTSSNHDFTGT